MWPNLQADLRSIEAQVPSWIRLLPCAGAREQVHFSDEAAPVFSSGKGKGLELQSGNPHRGFRLKRVDIVRRKCRFHHLIQEDAGIFCGTLQVGGPDIGQLSIGPQARS